MEDRTLCHDCKHPIKILEGQAPLLNSEDLTSFETSLDEDILKADYILRLAADPEAINHCLCETCLDKLVRSLEDKVDESQEMNKIYETELAKLEKQLERAVFNEDRSAEIESLELQLKELQQEEKDQVQELERLQEDLAQIVMKDQEIWSAASQLELKLLNFEEKNGETVRRIHVADEELSILQRTNVLNDLFYIGSCDQFGTISGLRLGRLDTEHVPWDEINAAWGQCALLLATLMKLLDFRSAKCNLYPMGSYSRISAIFDDSNKFELFCSDAAFTRMISRFNMAQKLFLECLEEFQMYAEIQFQGSLIMPYKISGHKISGFSITLDINHKDSWTRALRFMLQILKTLLNASGYPCLDISKNLQKSLEKSLLRAELNSRVNSRRLARIQSEEHLLYKEWPASSEFIPFIQERDNIGRLLTSPPKTRSSTHTQRKIERHSSVNTHKRFKLVSPTRIMKQRSISPSVGMYYKPNNWIKPSFSKLKVKKKRFSQGNEAKEVEDRGDIEGKKEDGILKRVMTTSDVYRRSDYRMQGNRNYLCKDTPVIESYGKFDMLKPELFLRKTFCTQFSSLKIQGNPTKISEALKADHFRELKDKMVQDIKKITLHHVKRYES